MFILVILLTPFNFFNVPSDDRTSVMKVSLGTLQTRLLGLDSRDAIFKILALVLISLLFLDVNFSARQHIYSKYTADKNKPIQNIIMQIVAGLSS